VADAASPFLLTSAVGDYPRATSTMAGNRKTDRTRQVMVGWCEAVIVAGFCLY